MIRRVFVAAVILFSSLVVAIASADVIVVKQGIDLETGKSRDLNVTRAGRAPYEPGEISREGDGLVYVVTIPSSPSTWGREWDYFAALQKARGFAAEMFRREGYLDPRKVEFTGFAAEVSRLGNRYGVTARTFEFRAKKDRVAKVGIAAMGVVMGTLGAWMARDAAHGVNNGTDFLNLVVDGVFVGGCAYATVWALTW